MLSIALSNDERSLLSGGKDRLVNVWDLRINKVVKKFRGHRDFITVGMLHNYRGLNSILKTINSTLFQLIDVLSYGASEI